MCLVGSVVSRIVLFSASAGVVDLFDYVCLFEPFF